MSDVAYIVVWVTLVGFAGTALGATVWCFRLADRNRDLRRHLRQAQTEIRLLGDQLRQPDPKDSIARDARHLAQNQHDDLPLTVEDIMGRGER